MTQTPFIDIHTHSEKNAGEGIIAVKNILAGQANSTEFNQFCSVGLHPWYISPDQLEEDLQNLGIEAGKRHVIAIGETGLDRVTDTPLGLQKQTFKQHLEIAARHQKPVIVHAVKAYPDIVEVYKNAGSEVILIFHGFNGNMQIAGQLLDRGFYLSFGESLFNENQKAADVFREIPAVQVFLETDESKKSIEEMYRKAATIKGMKMEILKTHIHQNFKNCFGDLP